jgi:radical SAM superfamily enzyme YgiQ (UPF0313 family)
MKAKVLVTHSYFLRFDPKQWKLQQPYAPLATLYACAMLRHQGQDVAFHDMMFASSPREIIEELKHHYPRYFINCDDGFNYLTKMCLTNMREAAFEMSRIANQSGCTVIISSSDSTDHSAEYLSEGADFIVVGEAEQTLSELVNVLAAGGDISKIPGLRYLENDALKETPPRANLKDLDQLPLPAWDLINMQPYKESWMKSAGYFSVNIATTRGCPYKCNWCAKPIYGNRYNSRSPQLVVKELQFLRERTGFTHVWFCDDIFGLKPGWVRSLADELEQCGLKIRFKIQSRVDLLLEQQQVADLKRAGCAEVWVGAESGSQKILDAMDKGTKVEQIYEATKMLRANSIKACFFLQFGYPGERKEDIDKTISMVNELLPDDIGISVSYPLPGTKFYESVKHELGLKSNWTDSDELAMMFRNTYPPEFYRKLQRYVHAGYRQRKAWRAWKDHRDIRKAASLALRIPKTWISKSAISRYLD